MEENVKENINMCVYIRVCLNHFAVHLKLAQNYKSFIVQFKKEQKVNIVATIKKNILNFKKSFYSVFDSNFPVVPSSGAISMTSFSFFFF